MSAVHPFHVLLCLTLALITSAAMAWGQKTPSSPQRHMAIDGLRGYLAFAVFLHHASIWYFYLQTGRWTVPPSHLYTFLGQGGLALFFMITGFLFSTKIININERPVDWLQLYVSRCLRLVPLYAFAIACLFAFIAIDSNGKLLEPPASLFNKALQWFLFTIPGSPDLNGMVDTKVRMAGVTWSLPYEWFYYFSLPLMAFAITRKKHWFLLIFGVFGLINLLRLDHNMTHIRSFMFGTLAVVLGNQPAFVKLAKSRLTSLLVIGLPTVAVSQYASAYKLVPSVLLGTTFCLIACGNTLFGVFTHAISRTLGEMAYGIYLLHGLLLYSVFTYLLGVDNVVAFTPEQYWLTIAAIVPFLICICHVAYRLIEQPAMRNTTQVTKRARRIILKIKEKASA
jgi:peptidoglycan/LPS O-acetylase OafA/YrhL